ncbi:MAG: MFS transporter, partial [Acidobacteria bacterium]|nr:MFS transporter [Acidobacteriota bacterium]
HYPNFRRMWLGACTSSIGTWMQKLAQAWLVLEISNSPFLLGLDAFLGEIPILLFSLVGGVTADRVDRRRILLASQVVQMSCAFTLALLFAFKVVQVWHILCLSFLVGSAQAFGSPAYQSLLPALVKMEDVSNAIAMNSIQFNVARVIGPVLGGIALTTLGASWCFALNGVSFIAVIIALLLLKIEPMHVKTHLPVIDSMKQGLGFIGRSAVMKALIALAFSIAVLAVPLVVFLPVFAKSIFERGPSVYTILLSTYGAGSITGALLVAAAGQRPYKGRTALFMMVGLGMAVACFSSSRSLVTGCMFLFLAGLSLVGVSSQVSTLVQEITADDMRGRVLSVYNVAFRGGMPIGSLIAGSLVPHFTVPMVMAANGVLISGLGLYFLFGHRKVAEL